MEIKPLPIEDQIEILRAVKKDVLETPFYEGLCHWIKYRIDRIYHNGYLIQRIDDYIPLFTIENAMKYAGAKQKLFWWTRYDNKNRLLFLDWMINKLEKQLNK